MLHRIITIVIIMLTLAAPPSHAQMQDVWSLERCVVYALDHNISIQQNVLNERLAKLRLRQSQYSQLPNANASSSYGRSFGRSIDPTTNQFINTNYNFVNLGANADVLVFGWFMKRNQIEQNKHSLMAARFDVEQIQNDVSLNVATGFLRALMAKEQIRVNEKQVGLSRAQLAQTKRFEVAGRVPELNVAQLESQLATDSANLITAISNYNAAILDLKALLNLDFSASFDIMPPDVEYMERVNVEMDPEVIYSEAYRNFGAVRSSDYRLKASLKGLNAARSGLWPQLSFGVQAGTSYASTYKDVTGYTIGAPVKTGQFVSVSGKTYDVYQPIVTPVTSNTPFWKQLDNNFRQTASFSLTIPIFNGWQSRYNVEAARIDVLSQQRNKEQAELKLKQDVYKAVNDARNSIQKYTAAKRAAIAANRAFDFAQKRYDLGLTNTIEYLTTQNNQYSADANLLSAKYDLIFRLKVIDYYQGKELKL